MKKALFMLAILTTLPAHATDIYRGEWGGNCRPDLQCWITIKPAKNATYTVTYTAADRKDVQKVICTVTGTVSKQGKLLAGRLGKDDVEIFGDPSTLFVIGSGNSPCGLPLAVNGPYVPIGD